MFFHSVRNTIYALLGRVAQLVRALRSHRRGHRFEPCLAYHSFFMLNKNILHFKLLIIPLVVSLLVLSGCSPHYHTVRLSKGVNEEGETVNYYAVTRNGMIIPEYVIDEKGNYPIEKDTAISRFNERRREIEQTVINKYRLPNNTAYQINRNIVGFGLLLIAPIMIPLDWLTRAFQEKKSGVEISSRSYLETAFEEPVPKEPVLKDPLSEID